MKVTVIQIVIGELSKVSKRLVNGNQKNVVTILLTAVLRSVIILQKNPEDLRRFDVIQTPGEAISKRWWEKNTKRK